MKRTNLLLALMTLFVSQVSAVNVTFQLDMNGMSGFTTPEVNGTFNGWCGNCNAMTDANSDGIWEVTLNLAAGSYEYKYSYDNWGGQETLIAGSSCTVTNSGFTNRTLNLTTDVVLPVVCWQSCVSCAASIPNYTVTFQVDMSHETGFTTPEVNGTFNGWCGNCNAMTDANGDGIWTTTVTLPAGSYEYKFSHDFWSGQESLTAGMPCLIGTNRHFTLSGNTVLPVVCYGSCVSCALTPSPTLVTFKVDMNNVASYGTPFVSGTFNSWSGNSNPMTDSNNDGIWETTLSLLSNTPYEFKYTYDNWGGQEYPASGSSCTITTNGFTNRYLNVSSSTTLPVTCFGSCSSCGGPANDNWSTPSAIIAPTYPSCASKSGTLLGCSQSSQSTYVSAPSHSGQDIWYRFLVPTTGTGIVRITANAPNNNVAIVLQKETSTSPFYSEVAVENSVAGVGNEIMTRTDLIPGSYYRVGIKKMDNLLGNNFTLCISPLRQATCATTSSPASPKTLCDMFVGSYTGANSYVYTFTNTANNADVHTYTSSSSTGMASTAFSLSAVQGLQYGNSYYVKVDASFNLANGAGTPQTVVIPGITNGCILHIANQPSCELSNSDRCGVGSPRAFTSFISTNWVCGAVDYEWKITPTTGLPIAQTTMRGSNSRYILVGSLNGIYGGATSFNVEVRPYFANGSGGTTPGNWSTTARQLCLITPAAIDQSTSNNQNLTLKSSSESTVIDETNKFELFPNPGNGQSLSVRMSNVTDEFVQVRIIDAQGRTIATQKSNTTSNSLISFNFESPLATGVYFVAITGDNTSQTIPYLVSK
jgi:hypothetical protein